MNFLHLIVIICDVSRPIISEMLWCLAIQCLVAMRCAPRDPRFVTAAALIAGWNGIIYH